jgi:PAS domain S-box-containing protein
MTEKSNLSDNAKDLRRRAEAKLRTEDVLAPEELSLGEVRVMLHELRVHQIELEMQNEELRRSQIALEESRTRYFDLYDLAPVGYVTLSPEGAILEANLTAADLLGTNRAALVRQLLSRFVLPEDQDVFYHCRRELMRTGNPRVCELRMLRGGASPFWARVEAVVSPDSKADERVARVVISDITTRKEAEKALQESQAALLKANEELDSRAKQLRLLAGELGLAEQRERQRLSQMLHNGLQQHLLSAKMRLGNVAEPVGSEDLKQAVEEIESILDESVKISRSLSAELSPPILHEGGIADGLEWLARWMRDRHRFDVDLAIETRPELKEDVKVLLFESVRELLLNVIKHAKVTAARVRLARVDTERLRVEVSDQGAGFEPNRLAPPGGLGGGFGLFSIRERIGLIGGVLEVESFPAKGSRFAMIVPARQEPILQRSAEKEHAGADRCEGGGVAESNDFIRVLIVDDHSLFREGMDRMLKKKPDLCVVGHAGDGQEAIDLAEKLKPDVILMDVSMPRVDGIEATRIIHRKQPKICIIGLSMYEDQDRAQAMRDAGACDYKTKGCAVPELLTAIRSCVPKK